MTTLLSPNPNHSLYEQDILKYNNNNGPISSIVVGSLLIGSTKFFSCGLLINHIKMICATYNMKNSNQNGLLCLYI